MNLVVALLVPVVSSVLGILGVLFQDRRARRSNVGRRKLALEDARSQVGFATEWLAANHALGRTPEEVAAATDQATAWLDNASRLVTATELPLRNEEEGLSLRRLVLVYPFVSGTAKLLRFGFWALSGWSLILIGTSSSQRLSGEADRHPWVKYDLLILVTLAAVGLVLRFLAVAVEDASGRGDSRYRPVRQVGAVRGALLLVRLHRMPARLARLLFYALLVAALYNVERTVAIAFEYWTLVWLPSGIANFFVYGGAAAGLRIWALSLDRPRPASDPTPSVPMPVLDLSTQGTAQPVAARPDRVDTIAP